MRPAGAALHHQKRLIRRYWRNADVPVSVLDFRLSGAKLASIRYVRKVSQQLERMSHILTRGAAQLGLIQSSGDRARVVQHMRD